MGHHRPHLRNPVLEPLPDRRLPDGLSSLGVGPEGGDAIFQHDPGRFRHDVRGHPCRRGNQSLYEGCLHSHYSIEVIYMRRMILALGLTLAGAANSQVTLDELDAAADAADGAMEEFRKRLNDPDPDRALAVLHLLVSKGDPDQRRMAVRHGLQSTDRAIRATTLRAIFDSEPTLRVLLDPVVEEPSIHFAHVIGNLDGVIDAEGSGSVTFKVNGY